MSKNLIVFDNKSGIVLLSMSGTYQTLTGEVKSIEVDIPDGKVLKGVDVITNKPILEDQPKTEVQILSEKMETMENYILEKEAGTVTGV